VRFGADIFACAPLQAVPTSMIGNEVRSFDTSSRFFSMFSPGKANLYSPLGTEIEGYFQMIKEDMVKWMPDTGRAMEIAKQKQVTFALVCKNVAGSMGPTLTAIEENGKYFKDYRVIILENNSGDNTGAVVKDWASRNNKVKGVSENIPGDFPREVNIANARNRALKIYLTPEYDAFPYLIFVDCDFPFGWPPESVTSFFLREDWAGACSNGEP
jgi:hypothetical protein